MASRYRVLQFHPRPTITEHVNVGVVAWDVRFVPGDEEHELEPTWAPAGKPLWVILTNWARALSFAGIEAGSEMADHFRQIALDTLHGFRPEHRDTGWPLVFVFGPEMPSVGSAADLVLEMAKYHLVEW